MNWLLKTMVALFLVLVVVVPRLLDLGAFLTADEKRWLANTNGFTRKLALGQWEQLLQQPHPGMTTQWLGALTVRYDSWAVRKLPLVAAQSLLVLAAGYIFGRLWGRPAGAALTLLLALNPLLIAHTRVYAMDSLMSLFLLLSLGCVLLWEKTGEWRYVIFSGMAGASAVLSKLPAVLILPAVAALAVYWAWRKRESGVAVRIVGVWLCACTLTLVVLLPSLLSPRTSVLGDFLEFFRSDDFTELHQGGPYYYVRSLLFFSTPLQLAALATWIVAILWRSAIVKGRRREHIVILLLFALLFVGQMSFGSKKGDRYILPVFLVLDALVVAVVVQLSSPWRFAGPLRRLLATTLPFVKGGNLQRWCLVWVFVILLAWQAVIVWQLHPHTLAYVNPLTKPWFGQRRLGWGEGLDTAAAYLNAKSGSSGLKVASYYPNEFAYRFRGEVVPAHQQEEPSVDYVVLYRAMFERGEGAWETDVLRHYQDREPERIIYFNGIPFVWIYKKS